MAQQTDLVLTSPQTTITPMGLIEMAAARGASIEQMQQLFELKLRVEADEAKKAFVGAMSAFKASAIRVTKDRENKQYSTNGQKAMYTSLGHLVEIVTPYLSANGLSARWDVDQAAGIKVTCIVTHQMGHSEQVSMICPPDKSGAKNPIQEIKSAITYAKGCTFESICGLASTDANIDDDGNGAEPSKAMPEPEYLEWMDGIRQSPNSEALKTVFGNAYKAAKAAGDQAAIDSFIKAKDQTKKELAK